MRWPFKLRKKSLRIHQPIGEITSIVETSEGLYVSYRLYKCNGMTDPCYIKQPHPPHRIEKKMTKQIWTDGTVLRWPNGKVMKGPNYFKPDIAGVLGVTDD